MGKLDKTLPMPMFLAARARSAGPKFRETS